MKPATAIMPSSFFFIIVWKCSKSKHWSFLLSYMPTLCDHLAEISLCISTRTKRENKWWEVESDPELSLENSLLVANSCSSKDNFGLIASICLWKQAAYHVVVLTEVIFMLCHRWKGHMCSEGVSGKLRAAFFSWELQCFSSMLISVWMKLKQWFNSSQIRHVCRVPSGAERFSGKIMRAIVSCQVGRKLGLRFEQLIKMKVGEKFTCWVFSLYLQKHFLRSGRGSVV